MSEAGQITDESSAKSARKSRGKTRLLSLADLDKRTAAAREAIELRDRLLDERGGADRMSALSLALVDSVATLTAMIGDAQARWLRGEPVDPGTLATLINARRREAELVGINPEPLDVTPDLQTYLKRKAA
jgi:hypothetical protein